MPSVSKTQQRLFGMVHAYQNGKLDLNDLPESLAKKIKSIADGERRKTGDKRKFTKGISKKDANLFAKTKHDKIPEKIDENLEVTEYNKDEIIEYLSDITDYTLKELNNLTLSEIEELYNDIVVKKLSENKIKIASFDEFVNESNKIKGGKSDNLSLKDIANKHNITINYLESILKDAIKIELEHTNDGKIAEEIVKDHLYENPLYYHKKYGLPSMEKKLDNLSKKRIKKIIKENVGWNPYQKYIDDSNYNYSKEEIKQKIKKLPLIDGLIFLEHLELEYKDIYTQDELNNLNELEKLVASNEIQYVGSKIRLATDEKLMDIKINNKSGLIDNFKKEILIPFVYDEIVDFIADTIVLVKLNNKCGSFDIKIGKENIPVKYDGIDKFDYGIAVVKLDNKVGLINVFGKVITPIKYDEIISYCRVTHYTTVKLNGKIGKVSNRGREYWY